MNWKIFITACVSFLLSLFPQNMIGCAYGPDAYDYYISFFHQNLPDAKGYQPFYFTDINFLYDENEPVDVSEILSEEWAAYCGGAVTSKDAFLFVNKFNRTDLNNLYLNLEKHKSLNIPDSVAMNRMTGYFTIRKDMEALGYILFAKKVEPFVLGSDSYWELPKRDSIKMSMLIKDGQQLYAASKKELFKLKYAYQLIRLAHYSGRYKDAIKFYDDYISKNKIKSVLQPLSLALKAGALFRTGKTKEAAYLFSKVFSTSIAKRVSNYLGFKWSIDAEHSRNEYLALCKNNTERADMMALFALGSTANELQTMKDIYQLAPNAEILQVLAVREINKLENNYLTPYIQSKKGGSSIYENWEYADTALMQKNLPEIKPLIQFLHTASQNNKVKNPELFEIGAAYASYMIQNYSEANQYLTNAATMKLTAKEKDQWQLTDLLVTINSTKNIDGGFEEKILPALQWLKEKASYEKAIPVTGTYDDSVNQWKQFYRNLMNDILAKRYHQQKDIYKEALAIGASDRFEGSATGIYFLQNDMSVAEVKKLYALMTNKKAGAFDRFLLNNNSISKQDVIDFAGTAYLREYNFDSSIYWLKKASDKNTIVNKDPFIDLLYDEPYEMSSDSGFAITKLVFAEQMQQLAMKTEKDTLNKSTDYYKIATAIYNMTYYGHTWELVQYGRSGTDGYFVPKDATAFQREYYGCFTAEAYFKKAMNASVDKNFKARCLFMMQKCSQKRGVPDNLADLDYEVEEGNKYFPQLTKEYSNTDFYKEAYTRCSYLRDFVKNQK